MSITPKFIFIEAKKTTLVDYRISEQLKEVDKGIYKLDWFSRDRIQKTISPDQGIESFKEAIKGLNINGYEYYEGDLVVHPLQIRL